ncbi:MAG: prolipoprotein diacylglyceryl transferase [Dehalococcoidia bacterium]
MPPLTIEIGWSPNITTIGGFLLTWHGLFTAIGILAGVQLSLRMARVVGYDPDRAYTLALVGVPSGIVGARAMFVAEHWSFYGSNLGDIFKINEGGITVWGAVLGGIVGAFLFALWKKYPVGRGLDIAAFGTILGMAIGRIGDLVNGEHLARATSLPWGVIYTNPDSPAFAHSIEVGPHHPATTYEMLADLVILGLLFYALLRPFRDRPGLTFFVFLVGYAVMRFFVTYLRVDSEEVFGTPLRTPQFVSLLVLLVSIPGIWYFARQPRQPIEPLSEPPPAARRATARRGG